MTTLWNNTVRCIKFSTIVSRVKTWSETSFRQAKTDKHEDRRNLLTLRHSAYQFSSEKRMWYVFQSETIVASFLHLMVLFIEWWLFILQISSLWCFSIANEKFIDYSIVWQIFGDRYSGCQKWHRICQFT